MRLVLAFAATMVASLASAEGDFSLPSCKSWNGTITERSGLDTSHAEMQGSVTVADIQDYCEQDKGGEIASSNGSFTIGQCISLHLADVADTKLQAFADCRIHVVTILDGKFKSVARIPSDDETCASGYPALVHAFQYLCPSEAARLGVKQP